MVCVTGQRSCDRLIARGQERKGAETKLYVVHCVHTGKNFLDNPDEADAVEYLFTAAQLAGGELSMIRSDDVVDSLVQFANEHKIELIIMGATPTPGESIITKLQRQLIDVEFDIIG